MTDPRVVPPKSADRVALNRAQGEIQVKTNVIMELGQSLRQRDQELAVTNERLRVSNLANLAIIKQRGDAVGLLHMVMREHGVKIPEVDRVKIKVFLDSL